jgi:hypothetical protein
MHLDTVIEHIHQRFGRRALTQGVSCETRQARVIRTGFAQLDDALGIGGLPRGKIIEFLGHPTSGKTTLALKFLAQAQKQGQWVSYVDPENAFDPEYAHRCGLDLSRLVVGFPDDLTQTTAMAEALSAADGISAVVLDAGERRVPDATSLRRIASIARSGAVLIVLCDTDVASALPHFASIRLQVVRENWIWHHRDIQGYKARIDVLKSRFGPTGRSVLLSLTLDAMPEHM